MIFQNTIKLMLIEDEAYDVDRVKKTIAPFKDRLIIKKVVADGREALNTLEKNSEGFDVIIMDYQIVGGINGERLIRKIKEIDPTYQIIVITKMTVNISDFDFANRLIEAGAMWYCTKYPGDIDDYIYQPTDFVLSILNAYEKRRLENEKRNSNKKLRQNIREILDKKKIIGASRAAMQLYDQISRTAGNEATVLIKGASGTGKELVANHIHYNSKRKFEKFITINCGSLPQELIESELFGFEKGSFTGASSTKPGLFEVANHGTVFLDEIGELPLSAQVKLLRVLQDGEIDKIGRTEKINVDVRIIAATNKDLQQAINEKKFRQDLFYRLNVVTIEVPPLKDRVDDIPPLVTHFLKKYGREFSIPVPEITDEALDYLKACQWPGNVRQLQNVIQRVLFSSDGRIELNDVKKSLGHIESPDTIAPSESGLGWMSTDIRTWREVEKNLKYKYFKFVRDHTGSDAEAARSLGLAPPNYHRMCKELGLK